MVASEWYAVPCGADGAELQHRRLDARFLEDGRVIVWSRHRRRQVVAPRRARSVAEATEIAIGLGLTLDMQEDARAEIEARERDRRRGFSRDRVADREAVREIRNRLDDPARVVDALGLSKGSRPQARGMLVCCPVHADRTPSCSVRTGADGTIACRCHGCGWTGDVLGLVAAVRGLDTRRDFGRVLAEAAAIAGVSIVRSA